MAYEDFLADYTEIDAVNKLTIAQHRVTVAGLVLYDDARVYRTFGAGYFDDLTHWFTFNCTNSSDKNAWLCLWRVSDVLTDHLTAWEANNNATVVYNYQNATDLYCWIADCVNHNQDQSAVVTDNNVYYCTVTINDTTATCYIYTDSARTVLHDTISITCHGTAVNTIQIATNYNDDATPPSPNGQWSGYVENVCGTGLATCGAAAVDGLYIWTGSEDIQFERDDDSPVQIWTGSEIEGIALVAPGHADASPICMWTGKYIRYWKKYS